MPALLRVLSAVFGNSNNKKVHRVLTRTVLHSPTARRHLRSTTREFSCADQSSHYQIGADGRIKVLNEKSNNLLPNFSRCAAINYYTLYSVRELLDYCVTVQCHKNAIFSALHFIVLNLMYHALTSALNSYEEKPRCYRTQPDQLYPRVFSLRPNRVLFVFTIFKEVIGKKILALRLRTSAT